MVCPSVGCGSDCDGDVMEIVVGLLVSLLAAVLVLWRVEVGKVTKTREKLITASLVAEAGTQTTAALVQRVKERDEEIDKLVEIIAEDAGVDGLAKLLNHRMHKNTPGGDNDPGMSN